MKKYIYLVLLLFVGLSTGANAQITWGPFFNNSDIEDAEEYKVVATNQREVVLPYFIYNQVTSSYDLKVDIVIPPATWANIYSQTLNIQSIVGQALDASYDGTNVYVLHVEDDQFGTHKLVSIAPGGTTTVLGTFTGLLDISGNFQ